MVSDAVDRGQTAPYQTAAYFESRFEYDDGKQVVWDEVARYLHQTYGIGESVCDVGAGYGYFLSAAAEIATERIAVDISRHPLEAAAGATVRLQADAGAIPLAESSVKTVVVSNVLEHLSIEEIQAALRECRRICSAEGRVIVITPNVALAPGEYWSDYTHRTALTAEAVGDLLAASGLEEVARERRFLPFSADGRLPVRRLLVRAYLAAPFRPAAGQSLVVARPET